MEFEIIDIHKTKELLATQPVTLVDIRDPQSYSQAHIKEAISLSDQNVNSFIEETDKNKPLICYCYHGFSSQNAAQFLKSQGFQTVYSMDGGFEAWRQAYSTEPSEP